MMMPGLERPVVIANNDHRFIVAEQMRQIDCKPAAIVLEPMERNTGPATLIAALMAGQCAEDALALLLPSDQIIDDVESFHSSVRAGLEAVCDGRIVIFGVRPKSAHTGYGYIEAIPGEKPVLDVRRFVEKPPREEAERYVRAGDFFWNAGICLFSAKAMIRAFERYWPALLTPCLEALARAREDLDFLRLDAAFYAQCDTISIDRAILEKADDIGCVPLRTGWSDLGSWPGVVEHYAVDGNGNAGEGDVLFVDSSDCFVHASDNVVTVVNGLKEVIVAVTRDAVLVTSKEAAQKVGDIVGSLKKRGHWGVMRHVRVHRPWGWFEELAAGDRYKVKYLMVKPGGKLSLQSHRCRAEHWVVIEGSVRVTTGNEVRCLSVGQSVHIPIGMKHRLENSHDIPARLIEVQTGDYLEDDDIVRYVDAYDRK